MRENKLIFIDVEDPSLQFSLAMTFEHEGYRVANQSQSLMADFWVFDKPVDLLILDNSEYWVALWTQKFIKIRCQFAKQLILILSNRLPSRI